MKGHVSGVGLLALLVVGALGCDGDQAVQGEVVGNRGGVIVSVDGRFELAILPGALSEDVDITLEEIECQGPKFYTCYQAEPVGTAFAYPATVTFELGGMDLDPSDRAKLRFVVKRGKDWNPLADKIISTQDETISASALYLSSFAVAAP